MDITATQISRYTDGQCHALAEAIADITGWQMVLWSFDDGETGHCMVRTPGGDYLDITGTHTTADMLAKGWTADDVTDIRDTDSLDWDHADVTDETRAIAAHLIGAAA